MPFKVRKSLVIGLGGTGRDAVLHAKRHCQEVYGQVPPTTRFLVIDTTAADELQLEDRDIALERHEFLPLTVHSPDTLVRYNEDIRGWFPSDVSPRAVTAGAGQIRALGRLALHANHRVRDSLNGLVNEINEWETARQDKFELFDDGKTLFASVVGSLAGGTGSGMFLDIAFLLRACDNIKTSDKLTAYLLLPGAFVGKPATRNVEPNSYAALRELDYYMDLKSAPDPATFGFGGRPIEIAPQPYNFVYLVNNVTQAGTVYGKVRHLTEFLGRGIFMSLGASGKTAGDIWDNLAHQLTDQQKIRGKSAHYSSFGLSELVYEPDTFIRRYALESAKQLVRALFLGPQLDASEAVEEFARQHKLREEGDEHNEVITGLVPNAHPRKLPVHEKHDKASVTEMITRAPSYVRQEQRRAEQESERNLVAMTDETADAVHDLVRERLDSENGLAWCAGFLRTLRGRLDGLRDEMTSEEEEMRERVRKEESYLDDLRTEKDDTRDGIFNRRRWSDLAERVEDDAAATRTGGDREGAAQPSRALLRSRHRGDRQGGPSRRSPRAAGGQPDREVGAGPGGPAPRYPPGAAVREGLRACRRRSEGRSRRVRQVALQRAAPDDRRPDQAVAPKGGEAPAGLRRVAARGGGVPSEHHRRRALRAVR